MNRGHACGTRQCTSCSHCAGMGRGAHWRESATGGEEPEGMGARRGEGVAARELRSKELLKYCTFNTAHASARDHSA